MKQGDSFMKVILTVLLCAIGCYFVYNIVQSLRGPVVNTIPAVLYESSDVESTTGLVVRQEQALPAHYDMVTHLVPEGEWVSKNQRLAVSYLGGTAKEQQQKIDELQSQKDHLDYALQYSYYTGNSAMLEKQITENLTSLCANVYDRNLSDAAVSGDRIEALITQRYSQTVDTAELRRQLEDTKAEISRLETSLNSDATVLKAPAAGCFSAYTDGLEAQLTPDTLDTMTVAQFAQYDSEPIKANKSAGKVITSYTWYYVTQVPEDRASKLAEGDWLDVTFTGAYAATVSMYISRVSSVQDGKCLVVFSCNNFLQDVTALRNTEADLVFSTMSGLRVPKEAIYYSDEESSAGVYILENSRAVWKNVEILHDNGETYTVKLDKSSTSNLWPGDSIILTEDELYDRKVMGY